jgi:hypothetical protein
MRVAERDAAAVADDAEIIGRSCAEPEQFAELFDRHAPLIHRYAARRVGREAADDLVADTFLAAFGKRRQYDRRHPDARPWLYGRLGLAIQWDFGGRAETILNPRTYAYMGDRTWPDPNLKGCKDCQNRPKGWLSAYAGDALVKMAFVDRAGQLP